MLKIIDEKGRIFNKINLIDLIVILSLLFLVPVLYLGYKIAIKKDIIENIEREFVELETNCQIIKLKPELLKHISPGDKELDESGQVIGEIISLGQSEPYKYEFDLGRGEKIVKEETGLKQIEAKFKLLTEVKNELLYYKDKVIKVGSPIEFLTEKYEIIGIPLEISRKKRWISLRVKFLGVLPELANIIKKGDTVKSATGEVEVEIQSILSNRPALVTSIQDGKFIILEHPFNKDIEASIDVLCEEKEAAYFYINYLVKIGNNIAFNTDLYSISGTIVGMETK